MKPQDLEDTIELDPITEFDSIKQKDPSRILFPVVSKIAVILAVILSSLLLLRAILIHINGYDISLINDSKPTFRGHNGDGYINDLFHPEQNAIVMIEKQKIHQTKQTQQDLDALINSIHCSFSQDKNLSNGQSITYACRYNATLARKLNLHIIDTSHMYTVMGLSQAPLVDPFQNIQTEWTMEDGYPSLQISPDKSLENYNLTYHYERIDDTHVLIHASSSDGYLLTPDSKLLQTQPIPPDIHTDSELQSSILQEVNLELTQCGQFQVGKQQVTLTNPRLIKDTYHNDQYIITVSFDNIYTSGSLATHNTFTATYTGTIHNHTFHIQNHHACRFDGYDNQFTLIESSEDLH